jgi:NAD dependent epimerase/dehydratase family enzyme
MRIFFTGGTGVIGRPVVAALSAAGHEVTVLTRNPAAHANMGALHRVRLEQGSVTRSGPWQGALADADVVVHFGGEPLLAQPLTPGRVADLTASRTEGLKELLRALGEAPRLPSALVIASSVSIYGAAGRVTDETAPAGEDALAKLFRVSEAIVEYVPKELPVTRLRFGQVISRRARLLGALQANQLPPPDDTPWSWVHVADAVAVARRAIEAGYGFPINVCSPVSSTVAELHRVLGIAEQKRGLFGRKKPAEPAAPVVLLTGQRARPANVESLGMTMRHQQLAAAVADARRG